MRKIIKSIWIFILAGVIVGCGSDVKDKNKISNTEDTKKIEKAIDEKKVESQKKEEPKIEIGKENINYHSTLKGKFKVAEIEMDMVYDVWVMKDKSKIIVNTMGINTNMVTNKDKFYVWQNGQSTGSVFSTKDLPDEYKKNNSDVFGVERLKKMIQGEDKDYKKVGEDKVLGMDTVVLQEKNNGVKFWANPNNLALLKFELKLPIDSKEVNLVTVEAVKFEEGIVKDSDVELPSDVQFK